MKAMKGEETKEGINQKRGVSKRHPPLFLSKTNLHDSLDQKARKIIAVSLMNVREVINYPGSRVLEQNKTPGNGSS